MALFYFFYYKRELKNRGYPELTEKQIQDLNENSTISNTTIPEMLERLKNSTLKYQTKITHGDSYLHIKPKNAFSNWGDSIIIEKLEGENHFSIKAKRRILSPDVHYFINALNIKELKEMLD